MIGWSHDPTIHQAIKAYDYQEEQRNKKEDFLTFHRELRRRGAKKNMTCLAFVREVKLLTFDKIIRRLVTTYYPIIAKLKLRK